MTPEIQELVISAEEAALLISELLTEMKFDVKKSPALVRLAKAINTVEKAQ